MVYDCGRDNSDKIYLNADILRDDHLVNFSWAFQGHIGHLKKTSSFLEKLFDYKIVLSRYITGVWGVEGLGEGEGATLSVSELKKGK